MNEPTKPRNPGLAGRHDGVERKPIPAGSLSGAAATRNALEAAGDPDPDGMDADSIAEAVSIAHQASGRDPGRPGVL